MGLVENFLRFIVNAPNHFCTKGPKVPKQQVCHAQLSTDKHRHLVSHAASSRLWPNAMAFQLPLK
jgi:hypothetical protein